MTVLVTAASKHGATAEIGVSIAARLAALGVRAEFREPHDVLGLDGYDAVVIGSAVYAGRWLTSARKFVHAHAETLRSRPVWLFSSGPIGVPPKHEEAVDVHDVLELTGAREHRLFGGRLDHDLLGFAERAIVRAVGAQQGDFRNWAEVEEWSNQLAAALAERPVRS